MYGFLSVWSVDDQPAASPNCGFLVQFFSVLRPSLEIKMARACTTWARQPQWLVTFFSPSSGFSKELAHLLSTENNNISKEEERKTRVKKTAILLGGISRSFCITCFVRDTAWPTPPSGHRYRGQRECAANITLLAVQGSFLWTLKVEPSRRDTSLQVTKAMCTRHNSSKKEEEHTRMTTRYHSSEGVLHLDVSSTFLINSISSTLKKQLYSTYR